MELLPAYLNILFYILIVIVYGAAMTGLWKSGRNMRQRRVEQEQQFVETLIISLRNDAVVSLADVEHLYQAIFEVSDLWSRDQDRLALFLRKASTRLFAQKSSKSTETDRKAIDLIRHIIAESDKKIDELLVSIPFSETPSPEKQLLEDIFDLSKTNNELISKKLYAVAKAIRDREVRADEEREQAEQSLNNTKRGVWVTIVAAFVSIGVTLWLR